jgi:hypothetical protein
MGILGAVMDVGAKLLPEIAEGAEGATADAGGSGALKSLFGGGSGGGIEGLLGDAMNLLGGGGGAGGGIESMLGDAMSLLGGGGGGAQSAPAGSSGDLVSDGAALQANDADQALSDLNQNDEAGFQQLETDLSKGNGNAAVNDIISELDKGDITKGDATALASQVQQTANAHGGGKINGTERKDMEKALGTDQDVIASGKTRAAIGFENFLGGAAKVLGSL